jgi:hypothetical protein
LSVAPPEEQKELDAVIKKVPELVRTYVLERAKEE